MPRIYPMEETSSYPPRRYHSNSDYESINEESSIGQNNENTTRDRISGTSEDTINIGEEQNNNLIDIRNNHSYIRRGHNNRRGNNRGRAYSIETTLSNRRNNSEANNSRRNSRRTNNSRRNNEIILNEISSNSVNLERNNRIIWNYENNITNENQKCIICQADEDDLILSKICICWSSYVCHPCMQNMAIRNIIKCPVCRRKLKYNLKWKTGTNIKNISYILLPYLINLIGLVIVPVWFFETYFFNKENINLKDDYKNRSDADILTLLCHPTLFILIMLFNKIIIYPFNIILLKTTALYFNYPRENILPLDFRSNFSKMYMYALLSYDTLFIIICSLINEYRISSLNQYFIFTTMLYTVPFMCMALCFITIGIHNTIVRIQNKIEKYVEYNIQSVHMNTNITREQQVLNRRLEVMNALNNLEEEEDEEEIDINQLEEEILNEIYESTNNETSVVGT